MTDFDCTNATCPSPTECLQRDACISPPENDDRTRVQQIIDETRERLRRKK